MRRRTKVFFDGGCRPNPGPIEVAAVIRGVAHLRDGIGKGSNGDAEWCALLHALELARAQGLTEVELVGDARAVIEAADRALRTGHATCDYEARLLALAAVVPPARIRWIKRQQNLAGIALAARHPR